jgi:hypothetical protein
MLEMTLLWNLQLLKHKTEPVPDQSPTVTELGIDTLTHPTVITFVTYLQLLNCLSSLNDDANLCK